ncbi:MAG: hypothetical protein G01um101430_460 [Parcubacteria group bacterium Gr01-1014_30]|nr:MAG: hypothetical protein G01um101430_460 [Parcubacteria group bacterium Gr01-1014_30]
MKKILLGLTLFSLLAATVVFAQQPAPTFPPIDIDVIEVLENIVDWLFTILLIVSAIAIIVAAFLFVTAAGDPEKTSKARNFVIYALIGVAVAIAARGLVALVRRIVAG